MEDQDFMPGWRWQWLLNVFANQIVLLSQTQLQCFQSVDKRKQKRIRKRKSKTTDVIRIKKWIWKVENKYACKTEN